MTLELCILASGSSGNCAMLRTPAGVMLIDIGIGPRSIASRLHGTGVTLNDIRAVCLTHLDTDHYRKSWLKVIHRSGINLYCHHDLTDAIRADCHPDLPPAPLFSPWLHTFNGAAFEPLPGVRFDPVPLSHDEQGSHGFVIEGFGSRIGYATDLGHVPDDLIERFCDLDILAIESNYDPDMQRHSGRPWFLQQRIMGGRGHLSNEQCFHAVQRILDRCQHAGRRLPRHVVLLHRSRQCNCPDLLRRLFHQDPRLRNRLVLAEQYTRTPWLSTRPAASRPKA